MIGKRKLALALLGIALLLLNPAGFCAGNGSGRGQSHPCCPAPATQHHRSGTGGCICIDRQPTRPALPSLDNGHFTAVVATDTPEPPIVFETETAPVSSGGRFIQEARFLTFHQILV